MSIVKYYKGHIQVSSNPNAIPELQGSQVQNLVVDHNSDLWVFNNNLTPGAKWLRYEKGIDLTDEFDALSLEFTNLEDEVDDLTGDIDTISTSVNTLISKVIPKYTIAQLRVSTLGDEIVIITDNNKVGIFKYDSTDITSVDNEGIILIDGSNRRYKRQYSGAINVKWFGAVGDGVIDDTTAVQLCIDSIDRGTIFFEEGNYFINNQIDVNKSNLEFIGYNTTFSADSSTTAVNMFLLSEDVENTTFSNLRFTSPFDQVYVGDPAITSSNVRYIVCQTTGVKNLFVKNCYFENGQHALKINSVDGVFINNIEVVDCASSILGNSALNINIDGFISYRNNIAQGDNMTHHFYTNGGDFINIKNCYCEGGGGKAFNIKYDSIEPKRVRTHFENITLLNTRGFYFARNKSIYLKNISSIGGNYELITCHMENESLTVDNLFKTTVFQPSASYYEMDSVVFRNVYSISPVIFTMKPVRDFKIEDSTFIQPNNVTGGVTSESFSMRGASVSNTRASIRNCTFIQELEGASPHLIRTGDGGVLEISNCSFINNSGTSVASVMLLSGGSINIQNCWLQNITRLVSTSSASSAFTIKDVFDITTKQPVLDTYVTTGSTYTSKNETYFQVSGDTLTISSDLISKMKGRGYLTIIDTTGSSTIETEGAETIDGGANLSLSATPGITLLYSDGSNLYSK